MSRESSPNACFRCLTASLKHFIYEYDTYEYYIRMKKKVHKESRDTRVSYAKG